MQVNREKNGTQNMPNVQSVSPVRPSLIQRALNFKFNALGAVNLQWQKAKEKVFAALLVRLQNHAGAAVLEKPVIHSIEPTYDLTVQDAHCFYANGVLVHNCDSTTQSLIYLSDKNWLSMTIIPPDSGIIPKRKKNNPYSV
jgi:hypothetical protein